MAEFWDWVKNEDVTGLREGGWSLGCPKSVLAVLCLHLSLHTSINIPSFKLVLPLLSFSRPGTTLERAWQPPPARDHDPESSPFRPPEPEAMRFVEPRSWAD